MLIGFPGERDVAGCFGGASRLAQMSMLMEMVKDICLIQKAKCQGQFIEAQTPTFWIFCIIFILTTAGAFFMGNLRQEAVLAAKAATTCIKCSEFAG